MTDHADRALDIFNLWENCGGEFDKRIMLAQALREVEAETWEKAADRCRTRGYRESASSQVEYFLAKARALRAREKK